MHHQVRHLCSNSNVKSETVHGRILHHLKSIKNMVNNGINYQPQLVQDFWTINRMSTKPPPQFCVPQDMWRLSIARQGHATPLTGKLFWCFLHPRKLRWQWKNQVFEDVSPTKNRDFPLANKNINWVDDKIRPQNLRNEIRVAISCQCRQNDVILDAPKRVWFCLYRFN